MPLELILNNRFDDPEEQARFVHMALSNVDRLQSLVTDFILLTNIDHGNLNRIRQFIDIKDHIVHPVQKRLERYSEKRIQFSHKIFGLGEIRAPRREFTHAILHLLDNAFKFCPSGGRVRLLMEIHANGGATLTVENEGPSIPTELREKVFERYYQGSQGDNREFEGLGVGLFIARSVFQSLGGNVVLLDGQNSCRVQAVLPNVSPNDICYG